MSKAPDFKSAGEVAEATAGALDQAACQYAHALYWETKFQELARLKELSQEEQDRIFNELITACVVLIMLSFEAPDLRVDDDMRDHFHQLKDAMPEAHVRYLRGMGVQEEHLETWRKLIHLRYDEYARDRHGVRAAAMELASREGELEMKELSRIQVAVAVQSVAIGCHTHICRGKTDGRDDLFLLLVERLGRFYVEFRIRMEGGKISPITRARTAIRRFFSSFQRKRKNRASR